MHRDLRATLQILRLVSKMENNNKAIIVALTEAFNDRNYTAIEQYVAENITEHRPGVQSGRNSTVEFLQSLASDFQIFEHQ